MFELLHTDARRKANLRQDLTSIAIAAALLALCLYAVTRAEARGDESRTAAAAQQRSRSPTADGRQRTGVTAGARPSPTASGASRPAAPAGRGRATAAVATRHAAADAPGEPVPPDGGSHGAGERDIRHNVPERPTQGATVDVDARVPDSALGHRAVGDSARRVSGAATRPLAPEVSERTELALEPVGGSPGGRVTDDATRVASRAPLRWVLACLLAFAFGWLLRGARRGDPASNAPPEDPGIEYR